MKFNKYSSLKNDEAQALTACSSYDDIKLTRIIEVANKIDVSLGIVTKKQAYDLVNEGIAQMLLEVKKLRLHGGLSDIYPKINKLNEDELQSLEVNLLILGFEFLTCVSVK